MPDYFSPTNPGSRGASRLVAATILSAIAFGAVPALGEPLTARDHHQRALGRAEAGDLVGAIEEWNTAWAIDQRPGFQLNIARADEKLGRNAAAIEAYRRYLARAPEAKNRAEIEARIEELRKSLRPAFGPPDGGASWNVPDGGWPPPIDVERPDGGADEALRPIGEGVTPAPPIPPERGTGAWLIRRPWFWISLGLGAAVVVGVIDLSVVFGGSRAPDASLGPVQLR